MMFVVISASELADYQFVTVGRTDGVEADK